MILYGSVLRGDAGEESGIDVLLVSTGDLQEVEEVAMTLVFPSILCLAFFFATVFNIGPRNEQ